MAVRRKSERFRYSDSRIMKGSKKRKQLPDCLKLFPWTRGNDAGRYFQNGLLPEPSLKNGAA